MKSRFQLSFIMITILCFYSNCQILNYWAQPLSATTMRPTFVVEGRQGYRIKGSVQVSDKQAYVVYFYRPNQYYPNNSAFQYFGFVGNGNFTSLPLDASGSWRIEVVPNNRDQNFIIFVKTQKLDSTYESYIDVARSKKLFVTYFSRGDRCNFSVEGIASGQQKDILIEMYQGTNSLDFATSRLLFKNTGVTNSQHNVNCIADMTGYYYIFISASERIMSMFPRVLVSYQSNNYPCPFSKNYQDINLNFPTCVHIPVFEAIYPCLSYDSTLQLCTVCDVAYILQEGSCYLKTECGLDQYFDKGVCFDVIANCLDYELVGGRCKQCIPGYSLQSNSNNQVCIYIPNNKANSTSNLQKQSPPPSQNNLQSQVSASNKNINQQTKCPPRTYLNNGFCVIIPDNCLQFDDYKKMCVNCASSYTLDLNTLNCILSNINCPIGFYNLGNNCVVLPLYCNKTNSWGNCTSCIINYTLSNSGTCEPIRCKQREFLSNGQCILVSQTCDTFDIFKGNCITCIAGHILDANGRCVVPQYTQQRGGYNGCPPRQYRQGNLCRSVDSRCNLYDQVTGYCLSCIDPRQVLDRSNGVCYKVTQLCQDRFYFDEITRTCVEVSAQCQTYNQSNGYCLTCKEGLSLIRGGCMYVTPCGYNQYRNQDGLCISADPNCDGVDQISGACLACKNSYQLNSGGICCYAPNYLLNQSCKQFLSENCKSQRPIFLNCQQCLPGYSLFNGVFGKCKLIQ